MQFRPSVASALALIVIFVSMNLSSDAKFCTSTISRSVSKYGVSRHVYSCGFWSWSPCTRYRGYYYLRYQTVSKRHCCQGWSGGDCAIPVCSEECIHGNCIHPNVCRCFPGWRGRRCDEPICRPQCVNGKCLLPDICICDKGYFGKICDIAICKVPCQNGGTCLAPGICTCTEQFTGKYCQTELCRDVDPPGNGLVFCSKFYGIRSCTFVCQRGYGFAVFTKNWNPTVCANSSTWSHELILKTATVPDCTEMFGITFFFRYHSEFSYTGNCHNMASDDKLRLQNMFKVAVKTDGFINCAGSVCDDALVNEELACSEISKSTKTAARDMQLHVTVELGLKLSKEVALQTTCDHTCRIHRRQILSAGRTVVNNIKRNLEASRKWNNIQTSDGNVLAFVKGSFRTMDPRANCAEEGQIRSHLKCLSCPKGTFFKSNKCKFCPLRTYQDQQTQTRCTACLSGLTTANVGATNLSQCRAKCKAGHYSQDGLEPCTPCPKDHYQHYVGWKQCFPCPKDTFTLSQGTVSKSNCLSNCSTACHGLYLCDNCTCVDNSKVCDGVTDCFDRSDETSCFSCDSESCVGRMMDTKTLVNSAFIISMLVTKVTYGKASGIVNFVVLDIFRTTAGVNRDLFDKGVMFLTPKVVTCECVQLEASQKYLVAGYYNGNRLILTDRSFVIQ